MVHGLPSYPNELKPLFSCVSLFSLDPISYRTPFWEKCPESESDEQINKKICVLCHPSYHFHRYIACCMCGEFVSISYSVTTDTEYVLTTESPPCGVVDY